MTLWVAATIDGPAGKAPANLSQGQPAEIDDQRAASRWAGASAAQVIPRCARTKS